MYDENSLFRSTSFHQMHARLPLWREYLHLEKFYLKIYLEGKFEGNDQIEEIQNE